MSPVFGFYYHLKSPDNALRAIINAVQRYRQSNFTILSIIDMPSQQVYVENAHNQFHRVPCCYSESRF